jgi:hypothetical protein
MNITHLYHDVLINIIKYNEIKDIVNIKQTCKCIYDNIPKEKCSFYTYFSDGFNAMIDVYLLPNVMILQISANELIKLCPIIHFLIKIEYTDQIKDIGNAILNNMSNELSNFEQRKKILKTILSEMSYDEMSNGKTRFDKMNKKQSMLCSILMMLYH